MEKSKKNGERTPEKTFDEMLAEAYFSVENLLAELAAHENQFKEVSSDMKHYAYVIRCPDDISFYFVNRTELNLKEMRDLIERCMTDENVRMMENNHALVHSWPLETNINDEYVKTGVIKAAKGDVRNLVHLDLTSDPTASRNLKYLNLKNE